MALDLEEMAEKLRVSLANETKESLTTWLEEQRAKEEFEFQKGLVGVVMAGTLGLFSGSRPLSDEESEMLNGAFKKSLKKERTVRDGYVDFWKNLAAPAFDKDGIIALPYKKIKLRLPRKVKKMIKKNNYYKIDVFDRELMVAFCKPKYL